MQQYYDAHKADFVRKEQVFLSEDRDLHRGQDAGAGGACQKEGQGSRGARRQGRKIPVNWRDESRESEKGPQGGELPPTGRGICV